MASFSTTFTGSENPLSESGAFSTGHGAYDTMQKVSGEARNTALGGEGSLAEVVSPAFSGDHKSTCTQIRGTGGAIGPYARIQSDGSGYQYQAEGSATTRLYKTVWNGSSFDYTALAAADTTSGNGSSHELSIEVEGTAIRSYRAGVLKDSVTDSAYSTGGPGFIIFNNNALTNSVVFDFSAQDVGGSPAMTQRSTLVMFS